MLTRDTGTAAPDPPAGAEAEGTTAPAVRPQDLGSARFRAAHRVRYAYVAGSMFKGIASEQMVLRMGRAGLLGYFGTGGLDLDRVERAAAAFRRELGPDGAYGLNLLASPDRPEKEQRVVDALLRHGVRRIEAASFVRMTPALVRYRVAGLRRAPDGSVEAGHAVLAKVSRAEVADAFLAPPPPDMVEALRAAGRISAEQAELARTAPMADDVCAEADSGGHTDQRPLVVLLPELIRRRDAAARRHGGTAGVRVGV
ncbi:acyltransferase, partial [Streptomyces sp. SB3404]|nr:acyltransferase [Streptomyces boncukensis]